MEVDLNYIFQIENGEVKLLTIPGVPGLHQLHRVRYFPFSTSDVMLGFYKNQSGSGLEKYYLMIEEWLNLDLPA
jgi:hypothetical protein